MYDYLDLRQVKRLKELVPYKVLAPDADEIIEELERLNNVINELVLNCYNSDMSYCEFEGIWQIAFNEKYNPDKIKELEENKQ